VANELLCFIGYLNFPSGRHGIHGDERSDTLILGAKASFAFDWRLGGCKRKNREAELLIYPDYTASLQHLYTFLVVYIVADVENYTILILSRGIMYHNRTILKFQSKL
jgi:hypothetical protein